MATLRTPTAVYVLDIANPGYGPIWATHVIVAEREWAFTDDRVLTNDRAAADRFAAIVRLKGEVDLDLWDATSMTDAEREAYWGAGGSLWQWEETEKAAGRW